MAWSKSQAKLFAKQILKSHEGTSWWSFVDDIREAILDAKIMSVVLGQDCDDLAVGDIRDLRINVALAMARLGLMTETARRERGEG